MFDTTTEVRGLSIVRICAQCPRRSRGGRKLCRVCERLATQSIDGPGEFHDFPDRERCDDAPLPPAATAYRPGTVRRKAVMRRRAVAGQQLHHPDDGKMLKEPDQLWEFKERRPRVRGIRCDRWKAMLAGAVEGLDEEDACET